MKDTMTGAAGETNRETRSVRPPVALEFFTYEKYENTSPLVLRYLFT